MKIRDTSTVYGYAITLCMGSFVFGYQLSSFSNLSEGIAWYNNEDNPSNVAHLMTYFNILFGVSTLVGIIFYNYFKQYGWILTFKVTDMLTIVAAVIGIIDLSITTQTWSRILFGFVTGINTILIPTFLTSILPGAMGAPAGTLNQFFIALGIFMGFWMGNLVLNNSQSITMWRVIVGLPIIAALIRQKCLADYFPYQALQVYMQKGEDELLQHYLDRIYEDTTIAQFKENKRLTDQDIFEEAPPLSQPLFQPHTHFYRIRLALALAIAGLNQLSGGPALAYFISNYSSHSPQQRLNMLALVNLLQVIVTFCSGQLLEKYGRRAFMQQGQKIIIIALFLIGIMQIIVPEYGTICLILIFIHMVGFSLSYGPCTFLIGTQVINDIFYPALLQWTLITFNFAAVEPLIQLLGLGTLCLIYCLFQIFAYFYLQSYQVQTQGKLRRDVYQQYRQLKSSTTRIEKPSTDYELKCKVKQHLNDGYFSFQQSKQ